MKSNQCLDNLLKSILNGCSEKEGQQLINSFIAQLKQEIRQEIIKELKENEPTVSVRIGDIFNAGSDCIEESRINPWYLNEGGNENSYYSVKQSVAIKYGLVW